MQFSNQRLDRFTLRRTLKPRQILRLIPPRLIEPLRATAARLDTLTGRTAHRRRCSRYGRHFDRLTIADHDRERRARCVLRHEVGTRSIPTRMVGQTTEAAVKRVPNRRPPFGIHRLSERHDQVPCRLTAAVRVRGVGDMSDTFEVRQDIGQIMPIEIGDKCEHGIDTDEAFTCAVAVGDRRPQRAGQLFGTLNMLRQGGDQLWS